MSISPNLLVHCDQRRGVKPCCCHDNLVGRVAVKLARQLGGLRRYLRRQLQKADAWISQSRCQPFPYRQRQVYLSEFHQFCNFPARDSTDAKPFCFVCLNVIAVILSELHVSMHPPNPDVRV